MPTPMPIDKTTKKKRTIHKSTRDDDPLNPLGAMTQSRKPFGNSKIDLRASTPVLCEGTPANDPRREERVERWGDVFRSTSPNRPVFCSPIILTNRARSEQTYGQIPIWPRRDIVKRVGHVPPGRSDPSCQRGNRRRCVLSSCRGPVR